MRVRDVQRWWNEFFFAPISVVPIACYRILFGALVLTYGLMLWPDLLVWFGARGAVSLATAHHLMSGPRLSIFDWFPTMSDACLRAGFLGFLVAAGGVLLGCATRVCSVIVFVGLVSLHHRDSLMLNSGDTFLRVASFFLMFTPAGAALSIDRLWRIARGRDGLTPTLRAPWAQRLLQIQLALVYAATLLWKVRGATWLNGTALYYTSRLTEFRRFPVPWVFEYRWMIQLATWSTLVIEFALGTLVWIRELRYWILLSGVLLHAGIEYSMNIPLFSLIMTTAYCTFIEGDDCAKAAEWLRTRLCGRARVASVFYDGHCMFCTRTATLLRVLDLGQRFDWIDFRNVTTTQFPDLDVARADRELLLRTATGAWCGGFFAFRALAWRLPLCWFALPVLYLPGMRWIGPWCYAWVARHRYLLMGRCTDGVCMRHT